MKEKGKGLELIISEKQDGQWLFSVLKTELKASKPVIQEWMTHHNIKINHEPVKNNILVKRVTAYLLIFRKTKNPLSYLSMESLIFYLKTATC